METVQERLATSCRCGLWAVLALGLGAQPAHAQPNTATRLDVTPFVGGVFASDLEDAAPAFGVAIGLGLNRHVGLEGEIGYTHDLVPGTDAGVAVIMVTGNLLYHLTTQNAAVRPYGTVGGALVRFDTQPGRTEADVEIAVNAGGGMKVRVGANVQLRGDLRFIHVDNAPNFWRAYGGVTVGLR